MTSRIQEIAEASAKLDALHKRINETVRTRDRGPAERERWSNACEEFHRRYPDLFYPGGDESLDALKRGESTAIATALDFLEADPLHFRSGYTKEEVWRCLREREFWVMARVMSSLGSEDFWRTAANLAEAADQPRKPDAVVS